MNVDAGWRMLTGWLMRADHLVTAGQKCRQKDPCGLSHGRYDCPLTHSSIEDLVPGAFALAHPLM